MTQVFQTQNARAKLYQTGLLWDGQVCATIGNWSCKDQTAGEEILDQIITACRDTPIKALIGPMDGDTWHSYRFVSETDGSAPFLMEPTSQVHDLRAFEASGFKEISTYFSARAPVAMGASDTPPADAAPTITQWDGSNPEHHFGRVHALSLAAFAQNLFYSDIDRDTFLGLYLPFVPMLKPELIFFAHETDGTLSGFLFAIPNYAEGPDTKTVILKTYAGLRPGVGRHLVHRFHQEALANGFETVIHGLIHDDNRSAERSRQAGGEVFRKYALFGQKL